MAERWVTFLSRKTQSGFSLIEIAIVLVIAGFLLSGLMPLLSAQRTNAAISATRSKGEAIVTALISFVSRNHRLPCPAIANIPQNSPGYGVEAATPGCTGTTPVPGGIRRGIVPWVSLGLTNEQGLDAYNRRFTYFVRQQETSRTADDVSVMQGNMTIHSDTPIGPGLNSAGNPAGNQVNSCTDVGGDNSCNLNAVAVIISHGSNGSGAFLDTGGQMAGPPPGALLEQENTDNNSVFIDAEYSSSDTNPFDDMLIAMDPDDILRPLAKDGSIPSALAVTMDRLNLIRQVLVAQIVNDPAHTIPATGPLPPIPPIPPPAGSPQDGWGMTLRYAQGTAGSNVCGAPAGTTTFTLTSWGVDRIQAANPTGQIDNIVVVQNNDQIKSIIQLQGPPPCP